MAERRKSDRFKMKCDLEGRVEFGYPTPAEHACTLRVRDVSASGISFVLDEELPGLEIGRVLEKVTVRIGGRSVRGDLVVMHLMEDYPVDAICGAMFCPTSDEDILRLREIIHDLKLRAEQDETRLSA